MIDIMKIITRKERKTPINPSVLCLIIFIRFKKPFEDDT